MNSWKVVIAGLLLGGTLGTSARASDATPEFTALAVRPSYSLGAPVLVRLTLTNNAQPAGYEAPFFVLIPRLTFGPQLPDWPYLQVAFSVTGPDGRPVLPTLLAPYKLAEPQITQFSELHAGDFFGRTVDLSAQWVGFSFPTPGKYVVKATLSTGARRWLNEWLKGKGNRKSGLPFSQEHVWGGTLAAAPFDIVVTK